MADGSYYDIYATYDTFDEYQVASVLRALLRFGIRVHRLSRPFGSKVWKARWRTALENPSLVLVFNEWDQASQLEELDAILSSPATKIISVYLDDVPKDDRAVKLRPYPSFRFERFVSPWSVIEGLISVISSETGQHFERQPVPKRPKPSGQSGSTGSPYHAKRAKIRRGRGDGPSRSYHGKTAAPHRRGKGALPPEKPPSRKPQRAPSLQKRKAKPPETIAVRPPSRESATARVLNANFAHSPGMKKLKKKEGLLAGEECCLLVEIGPRWKRSETIAKGKIDLSEVLAGEDDYVIQAVFVSDDFEPKMTSADIWVPAAGGRTFPYMNGRKADDPGPVSLCVRAPAFNKGSRKKSLTAHGRLCLYYKSYLLQSAVVSIGVVRKAGAQLKESNEIKVDFVLTGDFQEVRQKFQGRRIRFGKNDAVGRPVTLNLALNDDGHGQHRILAKHHLDDQTEIGLPPAWKKYDPLAGMDILSQFRTELLTCYEPFDPAKFANRREKFVADLTSLAIIGSKLYAAALSDLSVAGGVDPWDWEDQFEHALAEATVIQISRTGPATYVFPWAMVYEYPLEDGMRGSYESCRTLWEEWDDNALRTKDAELRCLHQDEHLDKMRRAKDAGETVSIICPYAFWGYKHIVEQPLSAVDQLSSVPECVTTGGKFALGIGVTSDLEQRDAHLLEIRTDIPHLLWDPQEPAEDREAARRMLKAPELVYFLCHGEKDAGQTYISIGEHDTNPMHMITANTLRQWKRTSVDKSAWQRTHPLVFINGCGTADLRPGLALDLISAFADLEVSGVIGTEVSLQTTTAFPAAIAILRGLANGGQLCPAIRDMRWELLARGDLLGLAYTPYGMADVHLE